MSEGEERMIYMRLERPEGYEDVAAELVIEDAGVKAAFCPTDATAEVQALRAFARGCLDDWPDVGMDGFDFQELATKTGLLEPVTVTAPCNEYCNCIEYHGLDGFSDGVICYRKTALLRGV